MVSTTRSQENGRPGVRDETAAAGGGAAPAPWSRDAEDVREAWGVDASAGLADEVVARRRAEFGANVLHVDPEQPVWRSVLAQLRETMILVLLAALGLTLLTSDWTDAAVIGLVIVVNTCVGVVQERRAIRAVAALRSLTAPVARVRRQGHLVTVAADGLVPGDILVVNQGDLVPADARLLVSHRLEVDESSLTGESLPVTKEPDAVVGDRAAVGDRTNMLHAGTTVLRGRGEALVTGTGSHSQTGRLADLLSAGTAPVTPLQLRLRRLGRALALMAVTASVLVAALGLLRGQGWEIAVLTAVSLAVAAVPESLPAVVALALAGGAHRMARRGAIIRSLPAVETLGSVTLLATDKTGTLTQGAMECVEAWTPRGGETALLPGSGATPAGDDLLDLLEAAVLCNDASVDAAQEARRGTEEALVRAAAAWGLDVAARRLERPRTDELPFDAVRRSMTTWHRGGADSLLEVLKGAPESVLPLVAQDTTKARDVSRSWARQGRRVLAFAWRQDVEGELQLLGLVALADPLRPDASEAIWSCHQAGIDIVLVTGDHPDTAFAVASTTGITTTVPEEGDRATDTHVQARVDPAGKLDLVRRWQEQGEVVAMTGDGVNDGPALRAADVGVAMGLRGTEVAKQAADIVLTDDSLATVVAAVEEGRRVFDNVRRFVRYGVSGGVAEVLVMVIGPFIGLGLPLLPGQILWINLVTHGLPGVAMGAESAEPDVATRSPRPPTEGIVTSTVAREIAALATAMTVASAALAAWGSSAGLHWQAMLFASLALAQLGVAVSTRSAVEPWWRLVSCRSNPMLGLAVLLSGVCTLAGLYLAPLAQVLHTHPLTVLELGAALLASAAPTVVNEVVKTGRRRRAAQWRGAHVS